MLNTYKFTFFRSGCSSTVYFQAVKYSDAYERAERYCRENGYDYFAV